MQKSKKKIITDSKLRFRSERPRMMAFQTQNTEIKLVNFDFAFH